MKDPCSVLEIWDNFTTNWCVVTRQTTLPLVNPNIFLYGDDGPRPPPCATSLYDRSGKGKTEEERMGKLMYVNIKHVVYVRQMVTQQAVVCNACQSTGSNSHVHGEDYDYFPRLLHRMRFGTTTDEDWRWMQHRRP